MKKLNASEYTRPFVFLANGVEMCEKSFVNLLGLADSNGFKLKTWNNEVDIFLGEYICMVYYLNVYKVNYLF